MTFFEVLILTEVLVCIWAITVCLKKAVLAPAMVFAALGMAILVLAPAAVLVWELGGRFWSWATPGLLEEKSVFVSRLWSVGQLFALILITLGIKFGIGSRN